MSNYGPDLQFRVFGAQEPPEFPMSYEGWEERAREVLPAGPFDYVAGGAGGEDTMRANREAFYRWRIRPSMLQDVADRDISASFLGTPSAAPFLLAPVGVLSIVHPEAELAVARASAAMGVPMILSTVSSNTIEDVAAEMGEAPRWFQLYPSSDREVIRSMVGRAESSGYSAVVVTLDTTIIGFRERDLRNSYLPFLDGEGIANYVSDPAFRAGLERTPEEGPRGAVEHFLKVFGNPSLSWDEVEFIREQTSLPVLLKGITHPADARLARERGIDGLVVSNHGGRQVDGAVAALDALPEVREAVGEEMPLLMDSGVRRGSDVLKALALGASGVLVGRPYVYGLAAGGEKGVTEVVRNLMADIDLELACSGRRSTAGVDRSLLSPAEGHTSHSS
ncbi:MAG: alpha-hydroxy-acid oxidizing protein [Rubrobacter sp.]|nr:alpha-hydroxy-acid oxidizing protein [Rubrobacter sp.]